MSTRGGWRVALRLARREAVRRKGQTLLMLLLIALPVLAVTAAAIVWRTQDVSSVESVQRRMGAAAAVVEDSGSAVVYQAGDPDDRVSYGDQAAPAPRTERDLRAVLGDERELVPYLRDSLSFVTDKGRADAGVVATDLDSPLTTGLFEHVAGASSPGPGEVLVSPEVVERGPGIGEQLTLLRAVDGKEQRIQVRVAGVVDATDTRGAPFVVGAPATFGTVEGYGRWLVGGGPVTWADVRALNAAGFIGASRAVLADPPPDSALPPELADDGGTDQAALTALATIIAMVLLEVVLLAGPAFAVRAKAQAHTLALVAATGGTPRQARRTVLATGVVVGLVGATLGVTLGIAAGTLAVPVAQHFDVTRFGPFEVPWLLLVPVVAFGIISALLAAVVPAFSASRQDVVAVLAGRRGEGRPGRRSPLVGVLLLAVGIVAAVLGSGPGSAAPALVAGSALICVLGMILLVPVAVSLAARLAARLPLALRFATRDAARHRTRTVPAVAAVGATVAGVVALGIALNSQEVANAQRYTPQLPEGYGSVSIGDGSDRAAIEAVLARSLPADRAIAVEGVKTWDAEGGFSELEFREGQGVLDLPYTSSLGTPYLVATGIPGWIGMTEADRQRSAEVLERGGMVLLSSPPAEDGAGPPAPRLTGDEATLDVLHTSTESIEAGTGPERTGSATAPARVVTVTRTSPVMAVLAPRLVQRVGLERTTIGLLLPGPISRAAQQDITEAMGAMSNGGYLYVERGYETGTDVKVIRAVLVALGLVLMLGGTLTATFLALSDARPDLATMAAVGARPRTRRAVAASYAAVVGFVGALLGAPVGFVPGLAVSRPLTQDFDTGATVLAVPWLLVLLVVVGLPLLTALVVGACARGRLPMTARLG
ncbi:FtsX-like permease family protein [Nocardioides sp. LML1-1-1.1]|uniref:FtsX-like permease family protein n=1 Tax=Nocardioides sp. LML1-1-1.1 TaxID=3135248 RepID=UPI00342DF170